jgi:uncharacterized membrane protein
MPSAISDYTPRFVRDAESARRARAAWGAWGAALGGVAALVGLIVLAPVMRAGGMTTAARGIYKGFSLVCHQMDERSFHVEGFQFAVCARCFGLYVGALLGVAAYPLARPVTRRDLPERAWLLAAALPTAVDFALGFFGVWENTHLSRFLTALLLGAASAFYVVPGLVDLSLTPWREFFRPGLPREG